LDKIQKKKTITDEAARHLRELGLIEGRRPSYFISSNLAASTSDDTLKAQYVKQRGFDDEHYKNMIVEYVKTYGSATRKDVDLLLLDKLPDVLSDKQKSNKISNLLGALRKCGKLKNYGTMNKPKYLLMIL